MSRRCVPETESIKRKSLDRFLLELCLLLSTAIRHGLLCTARLIDFPRKLKQYETSNVQLSLRTSPIFVAPLSISPSLHGCTTPHRLNQPGFLLLHAFLLLSPTPATVTYRALSQPDYVPQCRTAQGDMQARVYDLSPPC
jgi:hypothetical protein